MGFHKAERKKAKLRLALCGVSGSGKTYSALLMAQGLGGKIAMIDTENGSGELYANLCEYDVCQVTAPYTPEKYIASIKEAEKAGYDVIIIDSLSHAWAGEGGLLDKHDAISKASRSGNSYAAWREITPLHNKLVDTILQSPCHIIASMRSKTAYEVVDDGSGKKAPKKIGMAPVQRDGMEYEFTVVMDLAVESHIATASKDRTGLFDGQYFKPTIETGKQLLSWLDAGNGEWQPPAKEKPAADKPQPASDGRSAYSAVITALRAACPDLAKRENVEQLKAEAYLLLSDVTGKLITGPGTLGELNAEDVAAVSAEIPNIPARMNAKAD